MAADGMGRFDAAGMAATWWEDSLHELQTGVSRGYKAVIEAWLTTAEASQDDKNAPDLADQIAIQLLAGPQLTKRDELATALASLEAEIKAAENADDEDEPDDEASTPTPADIKQMKSEHTEVKKSLKAIDMSLLAAARQSLEAMSEADAPNEVIGVLHSRIERLVAEHFTDIERRTLDWYDRLVNKYSVSLQDLEYERDTVAARLDKHLKGLGYG